MPRKKPPPEPLPGHEIDLHGLTPEAALRTLARELHAARVRRVRRVLVITGRGMGNPAQKPILRAKVEGYLQSGDGARLGVVSFELAARGGALVVYLRVDGVARAPNEDELGDEWDDD
ncbi:MAG: Smr/MutS family protein [Planctomycetes bacterium]|nr:Smr/MutS family protein [Planctomycetota bacterium]